MLYLHTEKYLRHMLILLEGERMEMWLFSLENMWKNLYSSTGLEIFHYNDIYKNYLKTMCWWW